MKTAFNPAALMQGILLGLLAVLSLHAGAQSTAAENQGTAFAKSLAPTSASQIVNPQGVNAAAWGANTATATQVPTNLGPGFSNPTTSASTYATAKTAGLAALGNQALVDCANYVAGPNSDPLQTQACAAVNFLTNQCSTPTTQQAAIMAAVGTSQVVGTNCAGTYGQGQAQFNFQASITATDPVFTVINNIPKTVAGSGGTGSTGIKVCTTQPAVTTPAQYQTATCVKDLNTSDYTCSQYLNMSVTTTTTVAIQTDTCPNGTLVGTYCVASTSGPAPVTYVCPTGYSLVGTSCVGSTTIPAIIASYGCPTGQTLVGTSCQDTTVQSLGPAATNYTCPVGGVLTGTTCTTTATGSAPINPVNYWCSGTDVLSGTTCVSGSGQDIVYYPASDFPGCPNPAQVGIPGLMTMVGNSCVLQTGLVQPLPPPPNWTMSCVVNGTNGYDIYGWTCTYTAVPSYSCPTGMTLTAANECFDTVTSTTSTAIVSSYVCSGGTTSCTTTTVAGATISYTCPAGSTLSGTDCLETVVTTTPATPVYSCPTGDTLSGTNCIGTDTTPATVTYSCPAGSTLSGTNCITTTTVPATLTYSCVDGSTPVNGYCFIHTAQGSWTDSCGAYEASAGATLPLP